MRSVVVLLAVLAIAVVFTMAGESSCAECLHGCCARSSGMRRLVTAIGRLVRRVVSAFRPMTQMLVASYAGAPARASIPATPRGEVVSLRI